MLDAVIANTNVLANQSSDGVPTRQCDVSTRDAGYDEEAARRGTDAQNTVWLDPKRKSRSPGRYGGAFPPTFVYGYLVRRYDHGERRLADLS
jgi:hypothetical protein